MSHISQKSKPHITVIGAGFIGALITFTLVRHGYSVRVFDRENIAGNGVTSKSFGWVNTILCDFENKLHYERCLSSQKSFIDLNNMLDEKLITNPNGSILWLASNEKTQSLIDVHVNAGSEIVALNAHEFRKLVPDAADVPELSAFSPNDLAIETQAAAQMLLNECVSLGAEFRFGQNIDDIQCPNGKVSAVVSNGNAISTDVVIAACGPYTDQLLSAFTGTDLIYRSPCALISINSKHIPLKTIFKSPSIEVRSRDQNTLLVAEGINGEIEPNSLEKLGDLVVERLRETFPSFSEPIIKSIEVGNRPIPKIGNQFASGISGVMGLYSVVAHPGIILAPSLASEIATLISQDYA